MSNNLEMLQRLYRRPTPDQALCEAVKDYVRNAEGVTATPEAIVAAAHEQIAMEASAHGYDG